jgi:hypothetical protein
VDPPASHCFLDNIGGRRAALTSAWPPSFDMGECFASCLYCSAAVSGRRPLGKDVALDYEEMSDQDWEEEPEGESLSVSGHAATAHCTGCCCLS